MAITTPKSGIQSTLVVTVSSIDRNRTSGTVQLAYPHIHATHLNSNQILNTKRVELKFAQHRQTANYNLLIINNYN